MYSGGRRQIYNSDGEYIYNIRTLSVNIKFICTSFRNRQNSEPFRPVSQRVQMNFIFNDNVRILCLSCNVKTILAWVSSKCWSISPFGTGSLQCLHSAMLRIQCISCINNSLWIDLSLHSDTLSWFHANQSLLLLLNTVLSREATNINFIVFGLTRSWTVVRVKTGSESE
jgi:hypothetical protein